ncbi:MAG: fused MFS/spermidine synthase [Hyphomicrobiaceae bacterium]|nr:fused MFS/spermidine synthase [Hyphomicrobiaceae bacterium]
MPDTPRPAASPGRAPASLPPALLSDGVLMWTYTATTFLSAVLLFSVQPMFAKMVLPVLGGSPSVWAVAIFFFQAALLAGYCYAHVLIGRVSPHLTGGIHLGLCVLAFLVALPFGLPSGWSEPPPGEPYLWQIGLFTVAIGLPFVAVSANAPLLQAWFALTGHRHARDPYFLYAASNLGSLMALLAYPFLLEPLFGLKVLSRFWSAGFVLLAVALGLCFLLMRSRLTADAAESPHARASAASDLSRPTWAQRLGWVGLALVPSALLTAFTTHVSTDVASAPLIWVLPLTLYLLTFVLVFRERSLIPRPVLLTLHLASVVVALLALSQTKHETWMITAVTGVVVFFLSAMVAHRTLYEARPDARHLTEFYLWMSLGGALGGLSAALLAPKVFSEIFEYPLLLALSIACRPGVFSTAAIGRLAASLKRLVRRGPDDKAPLVAEADRQEALALWLIVAAGILVIYWVPWGINRLDVNTREWGATMVVTGILAVVLVAEWRHPTRQFLAALLMFAAITTLPSGVKRGEAQRSYFGVYRVQTTSDGQYHTLIHGTTLHGAQRVRDEEGNVVEDTTPATYYYDKSPIAITVAKVRERLGDSKGRYGVTGLGSGSLACHAQPGESWRFFEIDPTVVAIAANPRHFTFLSQCQPNPDIVLGDARLTIAKEASGSFDLIIMDAFTSDAVPVHLLTKEAIELFLDKVKPDGVVLLHISNRYLDLESMLAATLKAMPGAHGLMLTDDEADGSYAQSSSTVALFAKSAAALAPFRGLEQTAELPDKGFRAWTDDYSDIIKPFLSRRGWFKKPEETSTGLTGPARASAAN